MNFPANLQDECKHKNAWKILWVCLSHMHYFSKGAFSDKLHLFIMIK